MVGINQHNRHTWGATPSERIIAPKNIYGTRTVFPLHAELTMTSETAPERIKHINVCKMNCDQLYGYAKS